ncbi:hydrolase [Mergibacter septicus]|uniref:Cof-type HAD-IIB family hydrolase n=1 Tax=Mergibacter septicus TaxID=221402 RepID=UPI001C780913|nr:Cof-type HAD-IIB family hydrolase [Mergibacter septicus]QDJ13650.1 hydrolase [Mergibacter septicus]
MLSPESLTALKEQIKLAFFDIDETLYIKQNAIIPKTIPEVFRRLKQQGIRPAIATGRPRCAFPQVINQLIEDEDVDIFVTINGQHNSYQQQIITQYPLTTLEIKRIIDFMQQHKFEYGFVGNDHIAVSAISPSVQTALTPITSNYIVDPDYYLKAPIYQMLLFYPTEKEGLITTSTILGQDLKTVRWHPYAVDLLAQNGSKARGIQNIVTHLGLSMKNVIAFGDGLNDIEMLTSVGYGVAMGNACPELKAVADYVTTNIEQDGILTAFQQLQLLE